MLHMSTGPLIEKREIYYSGMFKSSVSHKHFIFHDQTWIIEYKIYGMLQQFDAPTIQNWFLWTFL